MYSEIPGKENKLLLGMIGDIFVGVVDMSAKNNFQVLLSATGNFVDPNTQQVVKTWTNPFTNITTSVPDIRFSDSKMVPVDFFYTIDIPYRKSVGLIVAHSETLEHKTVNVSNFPTESSETWFVNIADLIFGYEELAKDTSETFVHGTFASFSSWPDWLGMTSLPGNLVTKATVYRIYD